jgi:hypothetical protein
MPLYDVIILRKFRRHEYLVDLVDIPSANLPKNMLYLMLVIMLALKDFWWKIFDHTSLFTCELTWIWRSQSSVSIYNMPMYLICRRITKPKSLIHSWHIPEVEFGWTKDRALVDTFIMRLAAYVCERNDYEEEVFFLTFCHHI